MRLPPNTEGWCMLMQQPDNTAGGGTACQADATVCRHAGDTWSPHLGLMHAAGRGCHAGSLHDEGNGT